MGDRTVKASSVLAACAATVLAPVPLAAAQIGAPPAARSFAPDRVPFTFEHDGTRVVGESQSIGGPRTESIVHPEAVYVVGSTPELGEWDVTRAIKLAQRRDGSWTATVALPAGRSFEYKYITRNFAAGEGRHADNARDLSGVRTGSVPGEPEHPRFVWARLSMDEPVVHWVNGDGSEGSDPMLVRRVEDDGRTVYFHPAAGFVGHGAAFWIEDAAGGGRVPAEGVFDSPLRQLWVQGGEVFAYAPAPETSEPRIDTFIFNADDPDGAWSFKRKIRVKVPRGYDQHTDRRYPVLYFHDGRFVMDDGGNRTWRADAATADEAAAGRAREAIVVAVDQGDRQADYLDPSIMGEGQHYAAFLAEHLKPHIDASYRTRAGPEHTASVGASYGGIAAIYHVIARPDVFGLAGSFSPSFWATAIDNTIRHETMDPVRVYLDSGDAGNAADGYANTLAVRDRMLLRDESPNVLGEDVHHVVGYRDTHHESAWAERLPGALRYLVPAHEQTGPFPAMCAAGYAPPADTADVSDIVAYVNMYFASDPTANLVAPFDVPPDINDILEFFNQFNGGCD